MGGGRSSVLQSRAAGPRPAAGSRKGESEGVEQLSMARRGSRWKSLHDTCSAPASGKDEDARHGGDEARESFHPRRQGRDSRSLELPLRPYPHITRLISNCLIYPMDPKEAGEGFRRDYGVIYLDLPIGICTLYPQKLISN